MTLGFEFILNPRVSILKHNGGIYLVDSKTRTYASINEAMMGFILKPDSSNFLNDEELKKVKNAIEYLRQIGILIAPGGSVRAEVPVKEDISNITRLHVFVTNKCNLRCVYCYAHGGDTSETISEGIWRPALDYFFSNLGSIDPQKTMKNNKVSLTIHGGGEPTVEFDMLKRIVTYFCKSAHAKGFAPSIVMGSNGTYDDSVNRWIIENDINVNISLDGPSDVHNRLRPFRSGQPSYYLVIRNIQHLVQAGKRVSIRATITNSSVNAMEETVELAREIGLAAVHFEPVTLSGRATSSLVSRPCAEKFADNFLKCFLLGLKYDIDVKCSVMHCFGHIRQRFCSACGYNFCLTPEGNITTCYEVLDSRDPAARIFFIGQVDAIRKRVMLDQSRIEILKQRIADNMEACNGCFLRYQCAGDCPVKSIRYSKFDIYSPDPFRCQIAQRINATLIAWLADGVIAPRDSEKARVVALNTI